MSSRLERIEIRGLHGHRTVSVRFEDNTLILVGENGSGKTTFLRILFYLLSGRMRALANFRFDHIAVTINGKDLHISRSDIAADLERGEERLWRGLPPPLRRKIMELLSGPPVGRIPRDVERLCEQYGVPIEMVMRERALYLDDESGEHRKRNREIVQKIQQAMNAQILYLPTYRRIERELGSIFEGLDPDDLRRGRRHHHSEGDTSFIELVEFGMKDVQYAVDKELESLKEFARESLNSLTLKYLGDVVNKEYENVDANEIARASETTVRAVLDRIHESILTKDHKEHLYSVIKGVGSESKPSEHQRIIYHYFLKLLRFQEALQAKEKQISTFCDLCSEYIVDKRFVYNSASFSFSILPVKGGGEERSIELGDLSSGEKQIVSLFSHLYLSGKDRFFVLIDEPELSLSVPWQRRFLCDIKRGSFCVGLVAVTHSPFIYDNELRQYAHSLGEFVSI